MVFVTCIGLVSPALAASGQSASPSTNAAARKADPVVLNEEVAAWLVGFPLSCIDKLHEPPRGRGYLFEVKPDLRADFAKTRAFYGCSDWHSAVNSTWTMVKLLRLFPNLRLGHLVREKLDEHLTADTIKGEIAFFNEEGHRSFERPYGWAWLLRVHAELKSWPAADAQKWATNLEPLAKLLLDRTLPYLQTLAAPMRIGTHANTSFTLQLLLEYARTTGEKPLESAVIERAKAFFGNDVGCAPNLEPSGSDFFSPCLAEAALMGQVLPQAEFVRWLDKFMPAPDSETFRTLGVVVDMPGSAESLKKSDMLGAKAHLIGLGVSRAKALVDIASALPARDPRVAAYRKLALALSEKSITAMHEAEYAGTHWIATYIVDYLVSDGRQPAK